MIPNDKIYMSLNEVERRNFKKSFLNLLDKKQFKVFLCCYGSLNKEDFLNTIEWIKSKIH